jgi:excisionase family DNA binding protein
MTQEIESLDTKQLSALLNIPAKTIRNWTSQKKIPHYKLGALVRFNRKEISEWYEARRVGVLPQQLERFRIPAP